MSRRLIGVAVFSGLASVASGLMRMRRGGNGLMLEFSAVFKQKYEHGCKIRRLDD